ncbi:hypothetical protein BW13_05785 [Bifidobacterium sp. UTCIF-37]|uniref:hypothetical protein n=1 Tax=unclassified Bifidobacterium TaxID=2608897 RepID=UPI00112EA34E|nr:MULTISPECIES: hypothetical protein [unclassified Bifidobacterium]TPF86315.1 hypothetical protein BW13_05785 [Bifidobacterium sp. UTCIF-37]TPF88775.1 hypothetical protein BW11_06585 [Bifidobacterium sp. UTCIF-38]
MGSFLRARVAVRAARLFARTAVDFLADRNPQMSFTDIQTQALQGASILWEYEILGMIMVLMFFAIGLCCSVSTISIIIRTIF